MARLDATTDPTAATATVSPGQSASRRSRTRARRWWWWRRAPRVGVCRWVSVGVGGCRWVSVGVGGCRRWAWPPPSARMPVFGRPRDGRPVLSDASMSSLSPLSSLSSLSIFFNFLIVLIVCFLFIHIVLVFLIILIVPAPPPSPGMGGGLECSGATQATDTSRVGPNSHSTRPTTPTATTTRAAGFHPCGHVQHQEEGGVSARWSNAPAGSTRGRRSSVVGPICRTLGTCMAGMFSMRRRRRTAAVGKWSSRHLHDGQRWRSTRHTPSVRDTPARMTSKVSTPHPRGGGWGGGGRGD